MISQLFSARDPAKTELTPPGAKEARLMKKGLTGVVSVSDEATLGETPSNQQWEGKKPV